MTDLIVRILEISTGIALICVTLISAANLDSALATPLVLLPLIAVPIICSGMFGWHPFKSLTQLINGAITPLKQIAIIKPHSTTM